MAKRGGPKMSKEPKRKAVKVKLAERINAGRVTSPYEIMEGIIATERADLKCARIGIAWQDGIRPDADGRLSLGKCRKRSDLDRSLDGYDFIIILNKPAWETLGPDKRERLIFHELQHAQIVTDVNGQPKYNDQGRPVCRVRKHDIEDFREVVKKFGWQDDLSQIAKAGIEDAQRPLLKIAEQKGGAGGTATNTDAGPPEQVKPGLRIPNGEPYSETFAIKCKGMKQADVDVKLRRGRTGWSAELSARLGNYTGDDKIGACPSRSACLAVVKDGIYCWLNELAFTGTADQKRAMQRRREQMREQVTASLDKLIADAKFEEPPEGGIPKAKPEIEDEDEFDREVAEDEESQCESPEED